MSKGKTKSVSNLLRGRSALQIVRRFFPNVAKVVDATKQARIEVLQKDADSKAVKDHTACAMAVACKRQFHLDGVIISRTTAYLVKGKQCRRFFLPPSVSREVVSFDRGGEFAPGQYSLSAIPKSRRLGAQISTHPEREASKGPPKRFRHITAKIRTVLGGAEES